MSRTESFVDIRHVDVGYTSGPNILQKLTGKSIAPRSVLRDVSLQVDIGQQVVIYGNSGAGKSTLLRLLAGVIKHSRGLVTVNGKRPDEIPALAAGYVSIEESEPSGDRVHEVLYAFGNTHEVKALAAQIGRIAEQLDITGLLDRSVSTLSTTERLRVNLARAALSPSPLILLDDVVDQLGASNVKTLLKNLFHGRTAIIATRSVVDAEKLELPIALLHKGKLAHYGLQNEIAAESKCSRVLHAWVEGLRYDLLRSLRSLRGVNEVRLVPTDQFEGQRLRITVESSRYLPAVYDIVSQAPLIRIEEEPVGLSEIMENL